MTEVNFRDIPAPRYPEDELSSEPWYSVSPGDVFPEEFRHWLCADPRIGPLFEEMHADLFRASYWRGLQTDQNGHVEDVYAYRRKQRFCIRFSPSPVGEGRSEGIRRQCTFNESHHTPASPLSRP